MLEEQQEVFGELVDPEDFLLGETEWVARRLDVAFDGRLDAVQNVVLASAIDTSEFVSATLVFVLHGQNAWPPSCSLTLHAFAVELDACEPDVTFVGPALASLSVQDGQAPGTWVGQLVLVPSRTSVRLEWNQRGAEGLGPQTASISAALVVRRRVPPRYRVR